MIRIFCIALCVLFGHVFVTAQDACAEMMMLSSENVHLEYTTFDRKGKARTFIKTKVILVEETKMGTVYHFEKNSIQQNAISDVQNNTYTMRCYKDTLYISMIFMLPSGTLENYSSMQMDMETNDLRMPRHTTENSELPAGDISVVVSSDGVKVLSLKAKTHERKVLKNEQITTPAGTFNCLKVSEVTEVKVGFLTNKTITTTWYAPGMGMIKQEKYDKKGKLDSRTELQKKV
jgi:hypothetical protein